MDYSFFSTYCSILLFFFFLAYYSILLFLKVLPIILFILPIILFIVPIIPSGNRTPGSRSYSDLVDTWADSVYSTSSYSSLAQSLPVQWLVPINAH